MIILFLHKGVIVSSHSYKQESRETIAKLLRKKLIPAPKLYDDFELI